MSITMDQAFARMADQQDDTPRTGASEIISRGLRAIRLHLGMEVAFVSEISNNRRYFRYVDTSDRDTLIHVGGSDPLTESYCKYVIEGSLPELIPDACQNAKALTLEATLTMPVRAHVSVPIRFGDGSIFGTLCCFSS